MTHHIEIEKIRLDSGGHASKPKDETGQACLMEWVSIFAGVDYGDHPTCTSPVLAAFGRTLNDGLDDEQRQRLVPFIPRLVGTAGDDEADEVRAWMATDWLVRTFTPTWLRKAGLADRAAELEALDALTSSDLARAATPIIEKARAEANAARAAAWDAAGDVEKKGGSYSAQYDAAYAAAKPLMDEALRETTAELLDSALDLFGRRCDVR